MQFVSQSFIACALSSRQKFQEIIEILGYFYTPVVLLCWCSHHSGFHVKTLQATLGDFSQGFERTYPFFIFLNSGSEAGSFLVRILRGHSHPVEPVNPVGFDLGFQPREEGTPAVANQQFARNPRVA